MSEPSRCPLCEGANKCALVADPKAVRCWCFEVAVDSAARRAIPAAAQGKRCLCASCARGVAVRAEVD